MVLPLTSFLNSIGWQGAYLDRLREDEMRLVEAYCDGSNEPVLSTVRRILSRIYNDDPRNVPQTVEDLLVSSEKRFNRHPGTLGSHSANYRGLHVARVILANHAAHAYIKDESFLKNGLLQFEDFITSKSLYERALAEIDALDCWRESRCATNTPLAPGLEKAMAEIEKAVLGIFVQPTYGIRRLFYDRALVQKLKVPPNKGDEQSVLHNDTFFPALKWWWFPLAVGVDDGPFMYSHRSPILTKALLKFHYMQSVKVSLDEIAPWRGRSHVEGSFRINRDVELERLGLYELPVMVKANTLVVANVFGFHARGIPTHYVDRVSLHGSIRIRNPFSKRPLA